MGGRKRHRINLRHGRKTTVTKFQPTDKLITEWDGKNREWKVIVESENGLQIIHVRLTSEQAAA